MLELKRTSAVVRQLFCVEAWLTHTQRFTRTQQRDTVDSELLFSIVFTVTSEFIQMGKEDSFFFFFFRLSDLSNKNSEANQWESCH